MSILGPGKLFTNRPTGVIYYHRDGVEIGVQAGDQFECHGCKRRHIAGTIAVPNTVRVDADGYFRCAQACQPGQR